MNINNLSTSLPIDTGLLSLIGRILLSCRTEIREAASTIPVYLLNNSDFENEIDTELEQRFGFNDESKSAPSTEFLGCYCYEWPILNLTEDEKIFICPERIYYSSIKYCGGDYQGLFLKVLLHEYSHAAMGMNCCKSSGKFTWITESMANVGALESLFAAKEKNIIGLEKFRLLNDFCKIQPAAYHLGAILSGSNFIKKNWINAHDVWNGDLNSGLIFPSVFDYFGHSDPIGSAYPNSGIENEIIQDFERYFS